MALEPFGGLQNAQQAKQAEEIFTKLRHLEGTTAEPAWALSEILIAIPR